MLCRRWGNQYQYTDMFGRDRTGNTSPSSRLILWNLQRVDDNKRIVRLKSQSQKRMETRLGIPHTTGHKAHCSLYKKESRMTSKTTIRTKDRMRQSPFNVPYASLIPHNPHLLSEFKSANGEARISTTSPHLNHSHRHT